MFKKSKPPIYRRFTDLKPKPKKSSAKKVVGLSVGSALIAGVAGAFVKNKESGQ